MNSQHQIWSRWTFTVTLPPGKVTIISEMDVKENCARFAKKAFGTATAMRVMTKGGRLIVDVRTEGHPVHEEAFVRWMRRKWSRFFVAGFGHGTCVALTTKLEAGSRQDGTPSTQMILLPVLALSDKVH